MFIESDSGSELLLGSLNESQTDLIWTMGEHDGAHGDLLLCHSLYLDCYPMHQVDCEGRALVLQVEEQWCPTS